MYVRYVLGVELIELVNEIDVGEVEVPHYGAKSLLKNLCDHL